MDAEYDCIVLGTGLTECILSGRNVDVSMGPNSRGFVSINRAKHATILMV